MEDDYFEWDDAKALSNEAKHGISFKMARDAFLDAFAIEEIDDRRRTAETRFGLLGMVENRLLSVAYTMRKNKIRIISARLAEPHERRRYHNENREI